MVFARRYCGERCVLFCDFFSADVFVHSPGHGGLTENEKYCAAGAARDSLRSLGRAEAQPLQLLDDILSWKTGTGVPCPYRAWAAVGVAKARRDWVSGGWATRRS